MSAGGEALLTAVRWRCREPLEVVADEAGPWTNLGVTVRAASALGERPFAGSAVLAVDLARRDRAERRELVEDCWTLVSPGGSLVVVSPNPAARPAAERGDLPGRRDLVRLLRRLGKVKKWKDQPFRWLAASVLKRAGEHEGLDPEELARFEVTASLCRGRVLELGCGRGDLSGVLLARGHEVTGCDLARRKVEEAARRYPEGRFVESDILDLPAGEWDTVLLPEVLEHVDAELGDRLLEKAWSHVAPGGRLVVTVPNEDSIPHANHVQEFDAEGLLALLGRFAEPVLCVDQPFKWLMAHVDR